MVSQAAENFGLVAGALGILTLVPLLWSWLRHRLPSARMKTLDNLLSETEGLFRSAIEDGLITNDRAFQRLHSRIWQYVFYIACAAHSAKAS